MNGAFINKVNDTENAFNLSFLNIADGSTLVDLGGLNMSKRSLVQLGFMGEGNEEPVGKTAPATMPDNKPVLFVVRDEGSGTGRVRHDRGGSSAVSRDSRPPRREG